jgi:putative flippase GtrA
MLDTVQVPELKASGSILLNILFFTTLLNILFCVYNAQRVFLVQQGRARTAGESAVPTSYAVNKHTSYQHKTNDIDSYSVYFRIFILFIRRNYCIPSAKVVPGGIQWIGKELMQIIASL